MSNSISKVALTITHFTVTGGNEARVAWLQLFLLYYVNLVILMLTSIFQA